MRLRKISIQSIHRSFSRTLISMRIATREKPDDREDTPALSPAAQLGKLGGAARARSLTPEQRQEIARKGAAKRWANKTASRL
jgi:hypothetical protein